MNIFASRWQRLYRSSTIPRRTFGIVAQGIFLAEIGKGFGQPGRIGLASDRGERNQQVRSEHAWRVRWKAVPDQVTEGLHRAPTSARATALSTPHRSSLR